MRVQRIGAAGGSRAAAACESARGSRRPRRCAAPRAASAARDRTARPQTRPLPRRPAARRPRSGAPNFSSNFAARRSTMACALRFRRFGHDGQRRPAETVDAEKARPQRHALLLGRAWPGPGSRTRRRRRPPIRPVPPRARTRRCRTDRAGWFAAISASPPHPSFGPRAWRSYQSARASASTRLVRCGGPLPAALAPADRH